MAPLTIEVTAPFESVTVTRKTYAPGSRLDESNDTDETFALAGMKTTASTSVTFGAETTTHSYEYGDKPFDTLTDNVAGTGEAGKVNVEGTTENSQTKTDTYARSHLHLHSHHPHQ